MYAACNNSGVDPPLTHQLIQILSQMALPEIGCGFTGESGIWNSDEALNPELRVAGSRIHSFPDRRH